MNGGTYTCQQCRKAFPADEVVYHFHGFAYCNGCAELEGIAVIEKGENNGSQGRAEAVPLKDLKEVFAYDTIRDFVEDTFPQATEREREGVGSATVFYLMQYGLSSFSALRFRFTPPGREEKLSILEGARMASVLLKDHFEAQGEK